MSIKRRQTFTCGEPHCGRVFTAVSLRGHAPVCPDCKALKERDRLREAKRQQRARERVQQPA